MVAIARSSCRALTPWPLHTLLWTQPQGSFDYNNASRSMSYCIRWLYYWDNSRIVKMSMDGGEQSVLHSTNLYGLALDITNQVLYWDGYDNRIYSSYVDGSNIAEVHHDSGSSSYNSLTFLNDHLFWWRGNTVNEFNLKTSTHTTSSVIHCWSRSIVAVSKGRQPEGRKRI